MKAPDRGMLLAKINRWKGIISKLQEFCELAKKTRDKEVINDTQAFNALSELIRTIHANNVSKKIEEAIKEVA